MARITVEDCLDKVDNRFALIHLAAKRVRALRKGGDPLVVCKNEDIVTSLREIAEGKILQVKGTSEDQLAEGPHVPEALEAPTAIPEELEAAGEAGDTEAASPGEEDSRPEALGKDT